MAFVVAIAGMMLPAISVTLVRSFNGEHRWFELTLSIKFRFRFNIENRGAQDSRCRHKIQRISIVLVKLYNWSRAFGCGFLELLQAFAQAVQAISD